MYMHFPSLSRMARQAKREELKEAKLKSKTASEKQTNSIKVQSYVYMCIVHIHICVYVIVHWC